MTCGRCNEQITPGSFEQHWAANHTGAPHATDFVPCDHCRDKFTVLNKSLNDCANRAQRLVAIIEDGVAGTMSREGMAERLREVVER